MREIEDLNPQYLWVSLAPSSGEKVEHPFSPASFVKLGVAPLTKFTSHGKRKSRAKQTSFLPLKSSPANAEMGSERKKNSELDKGKM